MMANEWKGAFFCSAIFSHFLSMFYRNRPARWIWLKLCSLERAFIKERGAVGFLEKSAHPPSCESSLKLQWHLIQLLDILKQIANGAHSSVCGLLFAIYTCWQRHYEQIWFQWRNEHFKPRILLFGVGNSTINTPRCWQWRNELLRDIGNSGMNSSALADLQRNGEPQFSLWKSRHKSPLSLRRDEFHSHVANSVPNCQQLLEVTRNL